MTKKNLTESEVKAILKNIFNTIAPEVEFEKINLNQPLRDQVDIDSYDFYRMLILINEQTGVSIPDPIVRDLKNLNELIHYILKAERVYTDSTLATPLGE
jgi:acyl carrier protein